ncbi:unnamed protein product, partial [Adineta steineri]
ILRTMVDGVRKQHILSIRMIFYKKNDINTIYDSYSIVFDYTMTSPNDESTTSIHMIAHIIHQIEYMFNWNDALPNDVELKFVLSTLDQFENQENRLPSPLHFLNENLTKVYIENETNHLMGRLTTPDGKIWLKFLPSTRQLSGSSINSEDLPTQANLFATTKQKTTEIVESMSPKTKKSTKKSTKSTDSNKSGPKKKTGFLSAVKSFITPSRNSTPLTSSTPNVTDLVLIKHTSTPKPGETASRITIGNNKEAPTLSAIYEVSSPDARPPGNISSPTPSTITATDISSATTPVIGIERRSTVRGQAAIARKKIAAMQIRDGEDDDNDGDDDDDDDEDEEQFKKLFSRSKPKKSKTMAVVPTKKSDDVSDVSSISSPISNAEFIFTPPTARKRPTTDRTGDDDLAAEHGTPPKTPRTGRRNRIDDQTSIQATSMDTSDLPVNIDSPRLLRSITKKLQQQASAKKQLEYEEETMTLDQSVTELQKTQETIRDEEEMNRVYVQLERSSMALHYSMGK